MTTFTVDGEHVPIGPGDTVCVARRLHSLWVAAKDASFLAIATTD